MLRVEDVTVRFGEKAALDGVTLEVADGEVVTVLGPSGSGKTSLLRVVAGLQRPDSGRVLLAGEDLTSVPPHRRGIGLVFQDHALFHHRDVSGNLAFGLRMRGDPRTKIEPRVRELLELVGLAGYERRSVATLSGGEQQRVALARALAPKPRVLLLDEPLGSLDRRLRDRLLEDLARFLGLGNVRDGTIVRPEAVTVRRATNRERGHGVVETTVRHGPTVRLVVRLDGGATIEAAVTALDHPLPGDRVSVEVDPAGVVELPENAGE